MDELEDRLLTNIDPTVLVPPRQPGGKNMRNLPLFEAHPLRRAYRSRGNLQLPVEFHAYSANNTTVVFLANKQKVSDFLEPIGYEPVVVRLSEAEAEPYQLSDGEYAIVNLVMNDYEDTSAGPYKALPLSVFALRKRESGENAEDDKAVARELKGPTAALLPLLDPQVALVMGPLAMSKNQAALDVGRDVMGIDKFVTDVRIEHELGGTRTSVVDASRKQLLLIQVNNGSPEELLNAQARLFTELGIFGSFKILLGKNEPIAHPFIGWNGSRATMTDGDGDPQLPPSPAYCTSYTLNSPAFKLWRVGLDTFERELGCPLTDRLIDFDCKPILASFDKLVSVAVERDDAKSSALLARSKEAAKRTKARERKETASLPAEERVAKKTPTAKNARAAKRPPRPKKASRATGRR